MDTSFNSRTQSQFGGGAINAHNVMVHSQIVADRVRKTVTGGTSMHPISNNDMMMDGDTSQIDLNIS